MIPISDRPERPRRSFPFVTVSLIIINVLVFIYELSLDERELGMFISALGAVPYEILTGEDVPPSSPLPVQLNLFTSMFLHAGLLHIAGNMLFLWIFGDNVEDNLGHLTFLFFYLATGVLASFGHIATAGLSRTPSIGASGAIAGVLAAYLILFPQSSVRTLLIFPPFITVTRISAIVLIGIWFVIQLFSGLAALGVQTEQTSGIAFWAHIGGFVGGLILLYLIRALPGPRGE